MPKGMFFFFFGVFVLFCLLEVFLFCSPKALALNPLFSSCSSFVFFCFPFQNSNFSLDFCPSTLYFGKHDFFGGGLVQSLLFLPFPFLMFASVFQTNFPNMPFFKPNLFNVYLFIILLLLFLLLLLLFLFSCLMFFSLLFLSRFCFWHVFLIFLFCFLFGFRTMKQSSLQF